MSGIAWGLPVTGEGGHVEELHVDAHSDDARVLLTTSAPIAYLAPDEAEAIGLALQAAAAIAAQENAGGGLGGVPPRAPRPLHPPAPSGYRCDRCGCEYDRMPLGGKCAHRIEPPCDGTVYPVFGDPPELDPDPGDPPAAA